MNFLDILILQNNMSDDSGSDSDYEGEKKVATTIADDLVVTKYKMASEITNRMIYL